MKELFVFFRYAKDILQGEGLMVAARRAFRFMASQVFTCERFYVYEADIEQLEPSEPTPAVENYEFVAISSSEEAEELAQRTGFDIRARLPFSRKRLASGAVALCVLVDGHFAHLAWIAFNEEAKKAVNPWPYRVLFAKGQASMGGAFTIAGHRGKGIATYGHFKRLEFVKAKGFVTSKQIVGKKNIATQRVFAKLGSRIVAEARYIKFLGWEWWTETPSS